MPQQKFGKYTLVEKLTTGGMAEVFRGVAVGPGGFKRIVAIKKILPCFADSREFLRMFVDEATIAARLNHANIAQVYDFDIVDGIPYIAMEFVEGKDLRAVLQTCAALQRDIPYPIAVLVALEIAKGLYYVHSRRESSRPLNIVHRDVSPQNIMLSHAGEVKLVDFGIARAVERQSSTYAGTVKGKYAYMSPEQVAGESLDHRTDIFSLGVVLWEMLTLRRLFAGDNEGATISNLLKTRVPLCHEVNAGVPQKLTPIVLRALERNRKDRYPSMLAFHEALSGFLFDTGTYQEAEKLSQFLLELFPEEMERLVQGEHLAFEPDTVEESGLVPLEPGLADTVADVPILDERQQYDSTAETDSADPSDKRPSVAWGTAQDFVSTSIETDGGTVTEPLRSVKVQVRTESGRRMAAVAAGVVLALTIIGLTVLFGVEFARRTGLGTTQKEETSGQSLPGKGAKAEQAAAPQVGKAALPGGKAEPDDIRAPSPKAAPEAEPAAAPIKKAGEKHEEITFARPPATGKGGAETEAGDEETEAGDEETRPQVEAKAGGGTGGSADTGHSPVVEDSAKSRLTITVNTDPADAKVRIGEQLYPAGEIRLAGIREGKKLTLAIEKGGFNTLKDTIVAKEGLEKFYKIGPEGHLRIFVEPPEAKVKVDGKRARRGPRKGEYIYSGDMEKSVRVSAYLNGYDSKSQSVRIRKKVDTVTLKLKSASPGSVDLTPDEEDTSQYGLLDINAKPYANVNVNREPWGTTHIKREVKPGKYTVILSHPGTGKKHTCTRKVRAGKTSRCYWDFIKDSE